MGLPKSRNAVGLGNSLMNDRFGKGRGADMRKGNFQEGIVRKGENGETYITNAKKDASWMKMRSVTEQDALDEFLTTAQLAGTDFTAEKLNSVKIIHTDQKNPWLLSAEDERKALKKQKTYRNQLIVPRRPKWTTSTTPQELDEMERAAFMEWRRKLAYLQDGEDLLMTPFERNLEVWRQLWRVIERSDLIVQIVDARNPLHFRSVDLEKYVKEIDQNKTNLLLINKADMMTESQRRAWVRYFRHEKINFRFFSAALSKEENELKDRLEAGENPSESEDGESEVDSDEEDEDEDEESDAEETAEASPEIETEPKQAEPESVSEPKSAPEPEAVHETESTPETKTTPVVAPALDATEQELMRIISTDELEALFLAHAPKHQTTQSSIDPADAAQIEKQQQNPRKTQIGLVGYPNVGKSSTINALIGAKKVSVSATPGKTKHFQTIHLSDRIVLCDCPGLVFPNFATTKAELVCNGVLPIDQLREFLGPAGLVARRIPQSFFEAMYGMKIRTRPIEEGGTGVPTASEVLRAYARARGFATSGLGQPDESRAARFVLKDYVKGRLPYVHPPPVPESARRGGKGGAKGSLKRDDSGSNDDGDDDDSDLFRPIDSAVFNQELYDVAHLPANRRRGFDDESTSLGPALADPSHGDEDNDEDGDVDVSASNLSLAGAPSSSSSVPSSSTTTATTATGNAGNAKPTRTQDLDRSFFAQQATVTGQMRRPFQYQYSEQGSVVRGQEQSQFQSKKLHFKGNKRKKAPTKGNSFMED